MDRLDGLDWPSRNRNKYRCHRPHRPHRFYGPCGHICEYWRDGSNRLDGLDGPNRSNRPSRKCWRKWSHWTYGACGHGSKYGCDRAHRPFWSNRFHGAHGSRSDWSYRL